VIGCAVAHAVSYQSVTVETHTQTQDSPGEVYRGQTGTETGFPSSTSFFSCHYHPPVLHTHSFLSYWCCIIVAIYSIIK